MAGMDGLATLEHFKKEFPESFIIMVTSTATREIVEKCIQYGVKQYIRKDTPKQDILNILRNTFERMVFPHTA
jgi:DNA-binding NarL/FixJ family response regulator